MTVATPSARDRHHERVERVLRAHEAGVEQAERRASSAAPARWRPASRRCRRRRCGAAREPVDAARHSPTGVTAPCRSRRCGSGRPARAATTKILPSPTSPVRAPSQSASIVGCDERVGDGDLEADLLREPHLHGRAAVGLDAVELAAVPLDAAHRDAADLGAVERLQHVVGLLGRTMPITSFTILSPCPPNPSAPYTCSGTRRGPAPASALVSELGLHCFDWL